MSLLTLTELRAPGWGCNPAWLEREAGHDCASTLEAGIGETLAWSRQHDWL